MKIAKIETHRMAVPLIKPFKTALRTVKTAETLVVKITCDNGIVGWGEAPPTVVITGDSMSSIESAVKEVLAPFLFKHDLFRPLPLKHQILAAHKKQHLRPSPPVRSHLQ